MDLKWPQSLRLGREGKELRRGAGFSGRVRAGQPVRARGLGSLGPSGLGVPWSLCCQKPGALGLGGEGSQCLCIDGAGGSQDPGHGRGLCAKEREGTGGLCGLRGCLWPAGPGAAASPDPWDLWGPPRSPAGAGGGARGRGGASGDPGLWVGKSRRRGPRSAGIWGALRSAGCGGLRGPRPEGL